MTQILEVEEIPWPIPLSCRPLVSGEPMALERIGCQSASFAGRCVRLIMRPLEVPPRTNEAGKLLVTDLAMGGDVVKVLYGMRKSFENPIISRLSTSA